MISKAMHRPLALILSALFLASIAVASPQDKPSGGKPGDSKGKDGSTAKDGKDPSKTSTPEDKTYKCKSPKFQITAPSDKTWELFQDEKSRKTFLLRPWKERCVTLLHSIAGKKDLIEVSVTAIPTSDIEMIKFVPKYQNDMEDWFSDTTKFDVNDKGKFKGQKATTFSVEGHQKESKATILQVETAIFVSKGFIYIYEVSTDIVPNEPNPKDKYKKDLADIEKSFKLP